LKTMLKPFKTRVKSKTAVVAGPTPELTQAWAKSLALAAPKVRESWTFRAADSPEQGVNPIGSLADMRTLLPYNLVNEPEMAVLIVSADEAVGPGRPADSLKVISDRALAAGTIPIVCVPAPVNTDPKVKEKLDAFIKSVAGMCAQLGVPMVNLAVPPKNAKGEPDPKAGAEPMDKGALLVMNAIKHVHDNLAKD
jgi:hypothetical protein